MMRTLCDSFEQYFAKSQHTLSKATVMLKLSLLDSLAQLLSLKRSEIEGEVVNSLKLKSWTR